MVISRSGLVASIVLEHRPGVLFAHTCRLEIPDVCFPALVGDGGGGCYDLPFFPRCFARFCLLHSVYSASLLFPSLHAPHCLFSPSIHELYDYLRRLIEA